MQSDDIHSAYFGESLDVGDVNGDGYADLVAGDRVNYGAYLYYGGPDGLETGVETRLMPPDLQEGVNFAYDVDVAPDMNGDGVDELIGTATNDSEVASTAGAVFIWYGVCELDTDEDGVCATIDCDDDDPDNTDTFQTVYPDQDDDGYAHTLGTLVTCDVPSGYITQLGDCDDDDDEINPEGIELCDGVDNDCDGVTDGEDADGAMTWYADADGDGYASQTDTVVACDAPSGYGSKTTSWDCDDTDASIFPGATEVLGDGIDQDCDGADAELPDTGQPIDTADTHTPADSGDPHTGDPSDDGAKEEGCGRCSAGASGLSMLAVLGVLAIPNRRRRWPT